jgi:EAL domain-containing protein (putative c-di-GMP-specific phosphodiesterase class I)
MAVDDAGAGFSSFRHILELRPAFVKLDRSLVAGIDADPVRQALIAGMCHFATSAGCRLVAEGIETEAELATLIELEVPLGQGYLLGYPAPADAA